MWEVVSMVALCSLLPAAWFLRQRQQRKELSEDDSLPSTVKDAGKDTDVVGKVLHTRR